MSGCFCWWIVLSPRVVWTQLASCHDCIWVLFDFTSIWEILFSSVFILWNVLSEDTSIKMYTNNDVLIQSFILLIRKRFDYANSPRPKRVFSTYDLPLLLLIVDQQWCRVATFLFFLLLIYMYFWQFFSCQLMWSSYFLLLTSEWLLLLVDSVVPEGCLDSVSLMAWLYLGTILFYINLGGFIFISVHFLKRAFWGHINHDIYK